MRAVPWVTLLVLLLCAAAAPPRAAEAIPCADCHELEPESYEASAHGFLECGDCHAGTDEVPHAETAGEVDCATCHDGIVEEYRASVHGRVRAEGTAEAPDCQVCHGGIHTVLPAADEASPVHGLRLAETCGSCHADPEKVARYGIKLVRPLEAYLKSVHGQLLAAGGAGPTCSDCHGSHGIQPASDPRSTVFHQRVPETCGSCHGSIAEIYRGSVHGTASARGLREAPVCTDCHGEHRIVSPREKGSPVYATNIPKMTCGRCHGDLRLAEKYDLALDRVPAYQDSYHGLAGRSGRLTVAHCGSCHGVHDTLPSSDPRSHTHKDNLAATCGQCHPGAGQRFAIGTVHFTADNGEHVSVRWVRVIYLWLIYLTVGGMLLHNLLDLRRKVLTPPTRPPADATAAERMSPGFRIAHATLMVSFVVLVYTGFALTYPEARWAQPVLAWEDSLGLRGWLHRGASIVMLAALLFHLLHLALDRRARACIAAMRPGREDLHELVERVRYFFGRRPEPPRTGTLGYPEKLEYLALMWGIVVMAISGFVLWFDNLVLRWLPKWITDLATAIHFYEAVLASLAILVWHLYFVVFDPVVYPMDTAWLTGRSPAARAAERRTAPQEGHGSGGPEAEAAATDGADDRAAVNAARRS